MKLTLASAKPIGILIGTAISSALSGAIAGRAAAGQHLEAQPAISAPGAATSADIAGLREHFDDRFRPLEADVASIKGYLKAQAEERQRASP